MNKDPRPNTISKYTTTKAPDSETVVVSKKRVPDLPFDPGSRRNPHNDSKHQLLRDKENLDSLREFYRYLWWSHIHDDRAVIVDVRTEWVQEILGDMGP